MRLKSDALSVVEKEQLGQFASWILDVGDGLHIADEGEAWIQIPSDLMIHGHRDGLREIVQNIYARFEDLLTHPGYLVDRAILTPLNETVDTVNEHMLDRIASDEKVYLSSDTICKGDLNNDDNALNYPTEFLNKLKFPGFPNHVLRLKDNVPVILLRNLNQGARICNGTRFRINGSNIGEKVFIPRISLTPTDSKWPFVLSRRQYPITMCFAMTINKSQGQSLEHVGLYLPRHVFTHGQLYVAVSRVTSLQGLRIMTTDEEQPTENLVKNIVYKEVL